MIKFDFWFLGAFASSSFFIWGKIDRLQIFFRTFYICGKGRFWCAFASYQFLVRRAFFWQLIFSFQWWSFSVLVLLMQLHHNCLFAIQVRMNFFTVVLTYRFALDSWLRFSATKLIFIKFLQIVCTLLLRNFGWFIAVVFFVNWWNWLVNLLQCL